MRRLFAAILIVALAACKKDHVAEKQAEVIDQKQEVSNDDDDVLSSEPGVKILSLNLGAVNFNPSNSALVFNSVAVGKKDASGTESKITLSYSGWTHPSMMRFEKKWNGYNYWAAVTPYPNTDSQYENPHIFCSNDGVLWLEPKGISNPIEHAPEGIGYHSDVNLMFDNGTMYCYWRSNIESIRSLWVTKSTDGVHWSKKEKICEWPATAIDVISPSFIKDNNLYYCYGISNYETSPGNYYNSICIRRMISTDPIKGFEADRNKGYDIVKINNRPWGAGQDPWHMEVKKLNNIWLMLITTTNHGGYGSGGRLFLGYSSDGVSFTFNSSPICNISGTYKSSFNPVISTKGKCIKIEMWRAMMSNGWAVFHDRFSVPMEYSPGI
ncbi:hypothetical protein [Desertivirga arenae]|uniref:hypothetical protein n=1 Tax=Desertivirga arenae TaxID=2810309 RepID=UPI001A96B7BA|nr:hypothetical protein [Pedobacter sp. SYSU D00823]